MPARELVVITDSDLPLEAATELLTGAGLDVSRFDCRSDDEVAAAATGASALIAQWAHVGEATFAAVPGCRFVSRLGIGYDMVDLAAAEHHGVAVANVPDYCIEEVAAHTVALILSGVRDLSALDASVRAGRFAPALDAPLIRRPSSTRVVVVGFGRIGRRVAASLAALGFSIVVYDPFVDAAAVERAGYRRLGFEDALDVADVVTLHVPLTDATRHLIDAAALARLAGHAYIVNTCRGGLIDEDALARALGDGSIGGAGLDVFETEPLPARHVLRDMPNVVLTPHAAWYSPQSLEELPLRAAQHVIDFLAGRPVASIVNPGYGARQRARRAASRMLSGPFHAVPISIAREDPVRITRVEPIVLRLPEIELRADGTQDAFIVRIETDEGLYGIGEADTAPPVARAAVEMPHSHLIAQGLGALLIGRDPLDIEPIWHDLYEKSVHFGHRGVALHAISAIDIALYDLAGKILGQPVHRLLGGAFRDRVPVYASALMPWTLDGVREKVSEYREQGYRAVKLGWGPIGDDARQDVELVRTAREACGPELDLMIDAGRVWTWKQALQMSRRFEEFELSWLEEPLPVDDLDGYARLCEHSAIRIASAENETTIFAFREWIDRAGLDIVQPDLARCGGFTQARRIAALTFEKNRAMVPHAFSTGILVAASLHMTAAMPHGTLTEFSVADGPLVRDLLQNPFALEPDGTVRVPTGPGLGIELDEDVVARFRVA